MILQKYAREEKFIIKGWLILGCVFSVLVCFILYWNNAKLSKWEGINLEVSNELHYSLDQVEVNENDLVIKGWSFYPGENTDFFDTTVVLKEKGTDKYSALNTAYRERRDVTEAFGEEKYNYSNSGFYAKVKLNRLKRDVTYEIYILFKNDYHTVLQGTGHEIVISKNEK